MVKTISKEYSIPAEHPCLDGHFPGESIVPGVVILDHVRTLLNEHYPESEIAAILHVKFHHPLGPNQPFTILLHPMNPLDFKFECYSKAEILASGKFRIKTIND